MKKFILMPQTQLPSPLLQKLSQLDAEIKSILERTDIGEHAKATLYSQTLDRFLEVKRRLQQPARIPIVEGPQAAPRSIPTVNLGVFRKQYRGRAENVLNHLTDNTNVEWNKKGELISRGQVIAGSNIVDLIDDVVRAKTSDPPVGSSLFIQALRDTNLPHKLVGNKTRFEDRQPPGTPSPVGSNASTPRTPRRRGTRSRVLTTPPPQAGVQIWESPV